MSHLSPDFNLKLVIERLSQPPLSRNFSAIQLHDEVPIHQLLQLITDVCALIDESGPHRGVDVRAEDPEATAWRVSDLLRVLKYRGASNLPGLRQRLQSDDRMFYLDVLFFLLRDSATHKKRSYLAQFLEVLEIPPEFQHDDTIRDLSEQLSGLQEQFKELHRYLDGLRQTGNASAASNLKREIQLMEEEKQQVLAKISRLRKKVQEIPNHETWVEAAKALRLEQQAEATLAEKIAEQKNAVASAERKYEAAKQQLKEVKIALGSSGPDALFNKMAEDVKMNKYLATDNLAKQVEDGRQKIRDANRVMSEPHLTEGEFQRLEAEAKELNDVTAKLAEKRLMKNNSGDDKLALFRQQAVIIARKKEGTAQRLTNLNEEVARLKDELDKRKESGHSGSSSLKMLKGEDFKKYVSELRGKSNVYKQKKAELSGLTAEFGILQRTEEILSGRVRALENTLSELESRSGVRGYHAERDALIEVSERKAEIDEEKGKTLEEISSVVNTLMSTINDKKALLAPVIQDLRSLRTEAAEVEAAHVEKKRQFDAAMVGIDSEMMQLDSELKGLRQDVTNDQSRYHYLQTMIISAEISQERVMHEMKAYIGGDDAVEMQQKQRGFKTYRDAYNRRIVEQENAGKALREQQRDIKGRFEPSVKQMQILADVKKLLELKVAHNKRIMSGRGSETSNGLEGVKMTQDRLVL